MNENELLIYGRNPVKEALKAKRVKKVYLSDSFSDQKFIDELKTEHIPFERKSNKELDSMADGVHQGIVALIKRYEYYSLEDIIKEGKKEKNPLILVLDEINDPQNFGAIIRSSDIFGVVGIIIKKHNQVLLTPAVAKASAGAINFAKVVQVPNLINALNTLKKEGYWIVSAAGGASQEYTEIKYDFPTVLVIGNEGKGISRLILENSDYVVKIPMHGKVNSLNASIAAAVLMSYIDNDRKN